MLVGGLLVANADRMTARAVDEVATFSMMERMERGLVNWCIGEVSHRAAR